MTRHPYDFQKSCCMFDADAPIHDMSQTEEWVRCKATNELGLQCDLERGHKDDKGQVVHRHDTSETAFSLWVDDAPAK